MTQNNQNDQMNQKNTAKKKHHFFPKPYTCYGGGFRYRFLPLCSYQHPISRQDQEDEIKEEISQKNRARQQRHEAKKHKR